MLGSKSCFCPARAMLNILSIPLMTCITLMIGGGESPGIGLPPIGPISTAGGGSLSNGGGAQSTYFVPNCWIYSLGNKGCAVLTPPGITPDVAALMKWVRVDGWKFGPPTSLISALEHFRVCIPGLTLSLFSVFRAKALQPCYWNQICHDSGEKRVVRMVKTAVSITTQTFTLRISKETE